MTPLLAYHVGLTFKLTRLKTGSEHECSNLAVLEKCGGWKIISSDLVLFS